MTWLISQAVMDFVNSPYSQVQAEESSQENCLDGKQYAQLKSNLMQPQCWWQGKTTKHLALSRFGMTSSHLTEQSGEAVLMSFLAAFHVKTSQQQAKVEVSQVNGLDCGRKWRESSEKYNRDTFSLKTHQCSSSAVSKPSSMILSKSGTMRNGHVSQRENVAHLISVSEYGLSQYGRTVQWMTPTKMQVVRRTAESLKKRGKFNVSKGRNVYPPSGLAVQVHLSKEFPCKDYLDMDPRFKTIEEVLSNIVYKTGQLNPQWVEWLMGWPTNHTALQPLETDKYREWLLLHGKS